MPYEIEEETVPSMSLAAVRRQVLPGGVATTWRPALDLVWAFVRGHAGLWTGGHNVFVYHQPDPPDDAMMVEFGVQVGGAFVGDGVVRLTQTPAGRVVSTRHVGPVSGIGGAHEALEAWRAAHGERFAGVSWETYGDPGEDPAAFDVRVTYLLSR